MSYLIYPCGCKFEIVDESIKEDIYIQDKLDKIPQIKIDYNNINKNCENTWNLICEGKTLGGFQIESFLGQSWCKKIQPSSINELSDLVALIRPGCLESFIDGKHLTQHYCDRKHGKEDIEYENDIIKSILGRTQNIMVFQEQAILLASKVAGMSLQDSDLLRKAVGKKDPALMSSLESKFVDGCEKTGIVSRERGKELFEMIRASQRYSFNKSHSISYATLGYQTSYCKAHFPLQFFRSYLTGSKFKQKPLEEIRDLVKDARKFDIEVLPPDIRKPKKDFYIDGQTIKFGLQQVRGISDSTINSLLLNIEQIEKELKKEIKDFSWIEYLVYTNKRIGSGTQDALINSGACDFFNISRRRMLYEIDLYDKVSPGEQKWVLENFPLYKWTSLNAVLLDCGKTKKDGGGCHSSKRSEFVQKLILSLNNPPHILEDNALTKALQEEKYLGIPLTVNKVDGKIDAGKATHFIKDFVDSTDSQAIIAAEIGEVKQVKTKKGKNPGQDMCFFSISDSTGEISGVVCFPKSFLDYEDLIYTDNTILIQLRKNTNQERYIAEKLWQI